MPIEFFAKLLSDPMVGAAVGMAFPPAMPYIKAMTFFQKVMDATGEKNSFAAAALQFVTNPKFKHLTDEYETTFNTSKDNFINAGKALDELNKKGVPFTGTLGQLLKDTLNLPKGTN